MNLLPCCDRTTSRSEFAVFASLGFAGALMVVLAVAQATWFVGRDRISAGLESVSPADGGRSVATEVTGPADSRAAQSDLSLPTNSASPATPG